MNFSETPDLTITRLANGGWSRTRSLSIGNLSDSILSEMNSLPDYDTIFELNVPGYPDPLSIEPVDMAGGHYLYEKEDLSFSGNNPLSFSRHYNSNSHYEDQVGLGYGWSHSLNISRKRYSNPWPAYGFRKPQEAVAMLVALPILYQLLEGEMQTAEDLADWIASALVSVWAVDNIQNNAVSIDMGGKQMEFVKLHDDTWSAPPGITASLSSDGYTLTERSGTEWAFNESDNDNPGKINTITDEHGNTLTFDYSEDQTTVTQTVIGEQGYTRSLFLNYVDGMLGNVSDGEGEGARTVSYGYVDGKLDSVTDITGKVWGYGYDDKNYLTTMTSPTETGSVQIVENVYDTRGKVKTQTVPTDEGPAEYKFYFAGFRNIEEDPTANQTIYYFDDMGRNFATENALGHTVQKEFNNEFQTTTLTDPRGHTVTNVYDSVTHNLLQTRQTVNGQEQVAGNTYLPDYPYQLWKTYRNTPTNIKTQYAYKPGTATLVGNVQSFPAAGETITTYTQYYDSGLPSSVKDGRKRPVKTTFDYTGNYGNALTTTVSSYPEITTKYYPTGLLSYLTDRNGNTTTFHYDDAGRVKLISDPFNKQTHFLYWPDGKLKRKTDRLGHYANLNWTVTGKAKSVDYPDGSGLDDIEYEYDILERVETVTQGSWKTTFDSSEYDEGQGYDALGRPRHVIDPHGYAIDYAYDTLNTPNDMVGHMTKVTYPGGLEVSYSYDEVGRIENVTVSGAGVAQKTATYYYDNEGRLDYLTQFNGTTVDYGFDNIDRLTTLENKDGATAIASYDFTDLDGNGNRRKVTVTEPGSPDVASLGATAFTFTPEMKDRLVAANGPTGERSFEYDDAGQLSAVTSSGTVIDYDFDYEHRLSEISSGSNVLNQYRYDAFGNRLEVVRNGVETRYIYDVSGNLLAIAESNGESSFAITKYFIYGQGLLAMVDVQGESKQLYCYHFDAQGNTIAMTNAAKAVVNSYSYSPYGVLLSQPSDEQVPQPFKYVGQHGVMAEANGLYYMRARYYDPQARRFISEDPIGFEGGDVNLYAYVAGNPMMGIDPSGTAYIMVRPLANPITGNLLPGWTMFANNYSFYHDNNTAFYHQQIWFDSPTQIPGQGAVASNWGYFPSGAGQDTHGIGSYSHFPADGNIAFRHFDDERLALAISMVTPSEYGLFGYNCQEYIETVVSTYDQLQSGAQRGGGKPF